HVFKEWGINPINVFFTSMNNKQTTINEFPQLQKQLYQLVEEHGDLLTETLQNGVAYSTTISIEDKQRKMEDRIQQLEDEKENIEIPQDLTLAELKETV